MTKLIIFDLDGTLLDTVQDLADSCNYIMGKYNYPLHTLSEYKIFIGNGVEKLIERALPENKREEHYIKELTAEFVEYYTQHSEDKTAPYPGIISMLEELQKLNIKLAVASNKFDAGVQSLVKKYFKDVNFVSVLGKREGVLPKPDPQIVYDIIKESGIENKNEILYVGDTGTDMQTSVNASVEGVGVLWGFRDREELSKSGAVYIVEDPKEIVKLATRK